MVNKEAEALLDNARSNYDHLVEGVKEQAERLETLTKKRDIAEANFKALNRMYNVMKKEALENVEG